MASSGGGNEKLLSEVKSTIQSLLMSSKAATNIFHLSKDYMDMEGRDVPFKELGFPNLHAFLKSIPDAVQLEQRRDNRNQMTTYVNVVTNEKTEHINQLVMKQRTNQKLAFIPLRKAVSAAKTNQRSARQSSRQEQRPRPLMDPMDHPQNGYGGRVRSLSPDRRSGRYHDRGSPPPRRQRSSFNSKSRRYDSPGRESPPRSHSPRRSRSRRSPDQSDTYRRTSPQRRDSYEESSKYGRERSYASRPTPPRPPSPPKRPPSPPGPPPRSPLLSDFRSGNVEQNLGTGHDSQFGRKREADTRPLLAADMDILGRPPGLENLETELSSFKKVESSNLDTNLALSSQFNTNREINGNPTALGGQEVGGDEELYPSGTKSYRNVRNKAYVPNTQTPYVSQQHPLFPTANVNDIAYRSSTSLPYSNRAMYRGQPLMTNNQHLKPGQLLMRQLYPQPSLPMQQPVYQGGTMPFQMMYPTMIPPGMGYVLPPVSSPTLGVLPRGYNNFARQPETVPSQFHYGTKTNAIPSSDSAQSTFQNNGELESQLAGIQLQSMPDEEVKRIVSMMREKTSQTRADEMAFKELKERWTQLLSAHPDGLLPTDLLEAYKARYGSTLNLASYGFSDTMSMITQMPEVFGQYYSSLPNSSLLQLNSFVAAPATYATAVSPDLKSKLALVPPEVIQQIKGIIKENPGGLIISPVNQIAEIFKTKYSMDLQGVSKQYGFISEIGLLTAMSKSSMVNIRQDDKIHYVFPKDEKEEAAQRSLDELGNFNKKLPGGIVPLGANIPQVKYQQDPKNPVPIIVCEIYVPTRFYFQRKGKEYSKALRILMRKMQKFYESPRSNGIEVTEVHCNLYVAAMHKGQWHRAIITEVHANNDCTVNYIDFGTKERKAKHRLRYLLADFSQLPAQGMVGGLNLKPCSPNLKWPREASDLFLKLVKDIVLFAELDRYDKQLDKYVLALMKKDQGRLVNVNKTMVNHCQARFAKACANITPVTPKASPASVHQSKSDDWLRPVNTSSTFMGGMSEFQQDLSQFLQQGISSKPKETSGAPSEDTQLRKFAESLIENPVPDSKSSRLRVLIDMETKKGDNFSPEASRDLRLPGYSSRVPRKFVQTITLANEKMHLINSSNKTYLLMEEVCRKLLGSSSADDVLSQIKGMISSNCIENVTAESHPELMAELRTLGLEWFTQETKQVTMCPTINLSSIVLVVKTGESGMAYGNLLKNEVEAVLSTLKI